VIRRCEMRTSGGRGTIRILRSIKIVPRLG
jgi:hypothetical protein